MWEVGTCDSEECDANLKWKAVCPFKMLILAYQTTRLHIPGDGSLHRHCQDKLQSCILNSYPPLSLQNQVKKPIQKRKNYYFVYFKIHIFTQKRGRRKYRQPSHYCLSPKCLRLRWILKSWAHKDHQVLNKFQYSWFKQEVRQYIITYINLFFLLKMMKNWFSSGRCQSHLRWLNRL